MATLATRWIGDFREEAFLEEAFFAGFRAGDFFIAFRAGAFFAGRLAGDFFPLLFALFAPPFRTEGRALPAFLPAFFFLAAMRDGSCR